MDELNKTTYQYDENKLFTAYEEAHGNVHRAYLTYKDKEGYPSSKDTWYVYEVEFNWEKRLEELQEQIRKETDEKLIIQDKDMLRATSLIIRKFIAKLERFSQTEEDRISTYDFKTAWEIYRTTIGKPIQITKTDIKNIPQKVTDEEIAEVDANIQEQIRTMRGESKDEEPEININMKELASP